MSKGIMRVLLFVVCSFVLIGCDSGKKAYKSEIIFNFVASCARQGTAVKQCGCIMDSVMKDYSQQEYITMETQMSTTGKLPEDFEKNLGKARAACM